jgi:hypothetical protein
MLARLHSGETQVLCNCGVLNEGFDEPSIECIIVASPTKSRPLYVQRIGRGTRTHPGKADCLILDLVGVTTRHDLQTTAGLFGVDAKTLETTPLTEIVAQQQEVTRRNAIHGRLVAQTVELFTHRRLHWVKSSANRYGLPLADGMLVLASADLARWHVVRVRTGRAPETLAADLDLNFAQGFAEDYARKLGAAALINPKARWRSEPASPPQIYRIRKLALRIPPKVTKGAASDLIFSAGLASFPLSAAT